MSQGKHNYYNQGRHLRGVKERGRKEKERKGKGNLSPRKKKKEKKKEKKKKEKKRRKRKERKKGTVNNVKLLHIKCCFFQFFNSLVASKNLKKFRPPQEKVEMTPLIITALFDQVIEIFHW